MDIVPATIRDLAALISLEKACFGRDAWSLFDLIAVLTFPDVVRLKATDQGKMVGFIAGDPRFSQGFSWIATIGVLPDYQRMGIGRDLLRVCEQRLKTSRVRLTVRISNRGAIELYEKEGYKTFDIWRRYYDDGEDGLVMEKIRQLNGL